MIRLTYKTTNETLVNRNPIKLNGLTYVVSINANSFDYTITSGSVIALVGTAKNLASAKKLVRNYFVQLGLFGVEIAKAA